MDSRIQPWLQVVSYFVMVFTLYVSVYPLATVLGKVAAISLFSPADRAANIRRLLVYQGVFVVVSYIYNDQKKRERETWGFY
jgi:hypothetical protein